MASRDEGQVNLDGISWHVVACRGCHVKTLPFVPVSWVVLEHLRLHCT